MMAVVLASFWGGVNARRTIDNRQVLHLQEVQAGVLGVPIEEPILWWNTPEQVLPIPSEPEQSAGDTLSPRDRFALGYRERAGADSRLLRVLAHVVDDVIPCEAGPDWPSDPGNPEYRGLAQFHPDTWERARRSAEADWRDPWEQGWAMANWIGKLLDSGSHPGGTGGWPHCWNAR